MPKVTYTCRNHHESSGTLGDGKFLLPCFCRGPILKMVVHDIHKIERNPEYCKIIIDQYDVQTGKYYFDKVEEKRVDKQLGVVDSGTPKRLKSKTIYSFPRD